MRIEVDHTTLYQYSGKVARSTQILRLQPVSGRGQRVLDWRVELPARAVSFIDSFGNFTHVLTLDTEYDSLRIRAQGRVEVDAHPASDPIERINPLVFLRPTTLTSPDAALTEFARAEQAAIARDSGAGLTRLMLAIAERMPYRPGSTSVSHTAAESFALGAGVCQDHTHVFIACCRVLGVPARYVSGYVDPVGDQPATSHAWAEAWVGGRWMSFDVSNRRADEAGYLRLAAGRDYLDACPVRGVRAGGGEERLTVHVTVKVLNS
ncbi:MAG: transglutaminase family protein [Betaproteobacteria bacterium]|nr:transglutaminase family protein [Betaproteobacteria bacterium]